MRLSNFTRCLTSTLHNMSTAAVWSHKLVVDGCAFYVCGLVSQHEAFLCSTPVPATETWVHAFIIHFPSDPDVPAKELDATPRTKVKVNIVRCCLPPAAKPKPPPIKSPSGGGVEAVALRHKAIGSQTLFRKMRHVSKEPGWSWTQLRSRGGHVPYVNRGLPYIKLLA